MKYFVNGFLYGVLCALLLVSLFAASALDSDCWVTMLLTLVISGIGIGIIIKIEEWFQYKYFGYHL